MPYYRKLPSGRWQATVRHPSGRKVTKTDPLKRVVQQWAAETESAYRTGTVPSTRTHRVTVAQWHRKWLASRTVEASTARKDDSRWRVHVEPQWSTWPLDAISRLDVQTWVKKLTDAGVGAAAVHGSYELLSTLLAEAVDHGLLGVSPCRRITLPRRGKPEPRWFTRHEYDRLQLALANLTTVRGGRTEVPDPHAPVWRAWVALACFSGLRPGELSGLDVGSVDLDRGLVRVTQVLTRLEDGQGGYRFAVRPYPKSMRSVRSVPFPDEVAELLWPLVADRTDGPLFTAPRGGRVLEANFRRVWVRALADAGIEPVRPYVCRHTCASWLVAEGVPDRQIMQILGHADAHLIEVYAHLAPERHDAVRAAWANLGGAQMAHGVHLAHGMSDETAGQRSVR